MDKASASLAAFKSFEKSRIATVFGLKKGRKKPRPDILNSPRATFEVVKKYGGEVSWYQLIGKEKPQVHV